MAQCCHLIKAAFPKINDDIYQVSRNYIQVQHVRKVHLDFWYGKDVTVALQYVESVLETSGEDFESTDDLYEAIGEVLHEMEEDKSEKEIRYFNVDLLLGRWRFVCSKSSLSASGRCVSRSWDYCGQTWTPSIGTFLFDEIPSEETQPSIFVL